MIRLHNIERSYPLGRGQMFYVLRDIDLDIAAGDFVSVMGPSGAGKSTLLHILGMHDHGWTGEYFFDETAVHHLKSKERATLRNEQVGFVFQQYHLLDDLTVYENLDIPLSYRHYSKSERAALVADALDRFQIVGKKDLYPRQLSGGQQQLVGVARAIIASPKLLLADEPTGNLHSSQGEEIMERVPQVERRGNDNRTGHAFGKKCVVRETDHSVARRLDRMIADLKYAFRMLVKAPAFASIAILTLALGIGANTAIFSLIHDLFLRGLPFKDPSRLVRIYGEAKERDLKQMPFSVPKFWHYRDGQTVFPSVAADWGNGYILTGLGEPAQVLGANVTANYFDLLGVHPILGRNFLQQEEMKDNVALVTESFWRKRLGSDPGVIGRSIALNDVAHTIVGVLPNLPISWFGRDSEVFIATPSIIQTRRKSASCAAIVSCVA